MERKTLVDAWIPLETAGSPFLGLLFIKITYRQFWKRCSKKCWSNGSPVGKEWEHRRWSQPAQARMGRTSFSFSNRTSLCEALKLPMLLLLHLKNEDEKKGFLTVLAWRSNKIINVKVYREMSGTF